MSNPLIRIETVAVKDLEGLARRCLSEPDFAETAPISVLRAASQTRNPHAAPEDTALILAYDGSRCIGYHGLLPGIIATRNGDSKVSWLITFYVAPAWRSRGIGAALVEAIKDLNVDLVTTGITTGAEKTYRACGFRDLGELTYGQLRADRMPRWIRPAVYAAIIWGRRPLQRRCVCRRAALMATGARRLTSGPPDRPRFQRSSETVNWMIAHPWVVSAPAAAPDVGGYHFSRVRERFEFIPMETSGCADGAQGNFLISTSRHRGRTHVKVLDLFFEDPSQAACASVCALKQALRLRADRVDFPIGFLDPRGAGDWVSRLGKIKKRRYLYHPFNADSPLAEAAAEIALDYCDSDTAFT